MKIYVLQYIHSGKVDIYSNVHLFTDVEKAIEEFKRNRICAIKDARDEDPDSDVECPRDYEILADEPFRFHAVIPDECEVITVSLRAQTLED